MCTEFGLEVVRLLQHLLLLVAGAGGEVTAQAFIPIDVVSTVPRLAGEACFCIQSAWFPKNPGCVANIYDKDVSQSQPLAYAICILCTWHIMIGLQR